MNVDQAHTQGGERLSFYQLFEEKQLRIEIPIIQRDYAQGRPNKTEVRRNFLEALYSYLDENIPYRDLDFIYGIISAGTRHNNFVPLDGQQRLTTLFLLHWYLAIRAGRFEDFRSYMQFNNKSRFSYETRASAREFCDAMVSNLIDLDERDDKEGISDIIRNASWFYLSWKYDPTIQSMLVMLDSIEQKFSDRPDFYHRLTSLDEPIITFQFLDLKEFHLTDDLYIKMNSRGKQLSQFENFKAKLEQRIDVLFKDEGEDYELSSKDGKRSVDARTYFSNMIDTKWINYFWKSNGGRIKDIDTEIMNFIRVTLANQFALDTNESWNPNLRMLLGTQDIKYRSDYTDDITYYNYLDKGALSLRAIESLIKGFDVLIRMEAIDEGEVPNKFYYDHKAVFKKVLSHSISAQERLMFHAALGYCVIYLNRMEGYREWMRVMYNLTENTRIEDANDLVRGLKETERLLSVSDDILNYLSNTENEVGFFYGRQVEEERIKACLFLKDDEWREIIEVIEKHDFFKGQLGFLFEFSGVLAFFEEHGNCNWSEDDNTIFIESFNEYSQKSRSVFEKVRSKENENYIWERAVLTKGDYLIEASASRINFLSTTKNERDYSWKRLMRIAPGGRDEEEGWRVRRAYVKEVFDDKFDQKDFKQSCLTLISDPPLDWRYHFIQQPELIRICGEGFIRWESNQNIRLLSKKQLNSYHTELYSYSLYLEHLKDRDTIEPFDNIHYSWVNTGDDEAHISLEDWIFKKKRYQINIFYGSAYQYGIELSKQIGLRREQDYADEIKAILENLNFQWGADKGWEGYFNTVDSSDEIIEILLDLCEQLSDLAK